MSKWRVLLSALVLLGLMSFLGLALFKEPNQQVESLLQNKALPQFQLRNLADGALWSEEKLKGRWVLLNFWATWCDNCLQEHDFLQHLQSTGHSIIGINYKETAEPIHQALKDFGDPYEAVLLDQEGRLSLKLGLFGTPETFAVDPKGIIRAHHRGRLNQSSWNAKFAHLLEQKS